MALANWMLAGSPRLEERNVTVDGHRMHCLMTGSGPDLVLLHGLLGSAEAWMPVLGQLGRVSRIHAVDSLGIGGSERVPGLDAGLSAQADRVALFMQASGLRGVDVAGTSHGGAVAMMLAARYPELVRCLVLHAPANPFSNASDHLVAFYRSPLGRWFARQVPNLPIKLQELALGRMYGDAKLMERRVLDLYMNTLRIPGTVDHVMRIVNGWHEDMRVLSSVLDAIRDIPMLLLWGTRDRAVTLSSGRLLQEKFCHAEMALLQGVGHMPYEEAPGPFAEAVNRFLRGQKRAVRRGLQLVRN